MSENRLRVGETVKTKTQEIYVGWPDGSRRRLDDKSLIQLAAMEQDVSTYLVMLNNLLKTLQATRMARQVIETEKTAKAEELRLAREAKKAAKAAATVEA